jgi:hypothetical protein
MDPAPGGASSSVDPQAPLWTEGGRGDGKEKVVMAPTATLEIGKEVHRIPKPRPVRAVIEVHVRDFSQLFHSMDPAPFHERDLDREAEAFIVNSAKDLATDGPLALVVYLDQTGVDETGILGEAIRVHFARRVEGARRELRQLLRRGRTSLTIGLPLLGASVAGGDLVARLMDVQPLAQVLRESLVIGGWVGMWRPMEIFLYDWWPIRNERRLLERLREMSVRIVGATGSRQPLRMGP